MALDDPRDAVIEASMAACPAHVWERLFAAAGSLGAGTGHVSWREPADATGDGVVFAYPVYSGVLRGILGLLDDLGVIVPFDWQGWGGAARYRGGQGLQAAPVADAARLATVLVRGERFSDGTIAQAVSDGTLGAILTRLRRWFETEHRAARATLGDMSGLAGSGTDLSDVTALVEELAGDPLFAASQASKELFHTNMLAWYLEHWPQVRGAVAQAWGLPLHPGEQVTVRREWRHLDLVIEVAGVPVAVVENKVFSLPDEDQLRQYGEIAATWPGSPSLILLSLTDPGWPGSRRAPGGGAGWSYRSYTDLAAALQAAAADISRTDRFAGELLDRWMNLLGALSRLSAVAGRPAPDASLLLPAPIRAALARARLDAPIQKMRCQQVAAGLAAHGVQAMVGLTRGTGLVEWFTGAPEGVRLGWQLQGDQFRLAIVVPRQHSGYGRDDVNRAAREEEAARHPEVFDFAAVRAVTGATAADGFRHYAPDFVYRYTRVPGITVGQAIQIGSTYAQLIARAAN